MRGITVPLLGAVLLGGQALAAATGGTPPAPVQEVSRGTQTASASKPAGRHHRRRHHATATAAPKTEVAPK